MNGLYPGDKTILLFDGVCFTCNALVKRIIQSDKKDQFRFAAQQSDIGQKILQAFGIPFTGEINSMALIEGGRVYRYSEACFRICRTLGGVWKAGLVFSWLPRAWTDFFYLTYSRHRHVFGKHEKCRIPDAHERAKFLS